MSAAQRMRFRGHSPRTISNGRPTFSAHRRRAGVEARPYGGHPHLTHVAPTPQSRRKAPRQLPFQGSQGVGRGLRRLRICLPRCGYLRLATSRKGRRPRRPAAVGLLGWGGCGPSAWPIATAIDTVRPPLSSAQRMQSRGHSPRTFVTGAHTFPKHCRGGYKASAPNPPHPSSGGSQEAAGFVFFGEHALEQGVEVRAVAGDAEVDELVRDDVFEAEPRPGREAEGEAHGAARGRTLDRVFAHVAQRPGGRA